jgi:hypothetical protein
MQSNREHSRPGATGRRTKRNLTIGVESLESRALLAGGGGYSGGGGGGGGTTGGGGGGTGGLAGGGGSVTLTPPTISTPSLNNPLAGATGTGPNVLYPMQPLSSTPPAAKAPRALAESLHASGIVKKAPHFYQFYTGPKWAELDAVKASAKLAADGTFTFTGTNAGAIKKLPAVYVWGIERSGNLGPGPFTDRPNITFDAVVVVTLTSAHTATAQVDDFLSNTSTNLPAGSVSIHGRTVTVTVAGSLLPSHPGVLPPSQFRFDYWPDDAGAGTSSSVASFAPEFTTAQVGTSK